MNAPLSLSLLFSRMTAGSVRELDSSLTVSHTPPESLSLEPVMITALCLLRRIHLLCRGVPVHDGKAAGGVQRARAEADPALVCPQTAERLPRPTQQTRGHLLLLLGRSHAGGELVKSSARLNQFIWWYHQYSHRNTIYWMHCKIWVSYLVLFSSINI